MHDNLVTSVELCDNVKFISDGYEVLLRCADQDIFIDRQKAKKIVAWLVSVYGPQSFTGNGNGNGNA